MKFRTEIPVPHFPFAISYDDRVLFLGSCFSEHISNFFIERKFETMANPFGIQFNPLSIAFSLDLMTEKQQLSERFFQFFDEKWISFAHHGKFSNPDKNLFEDSISSSVKNSCDFIRKTDVLFITLGTAYYYFHKKRELIVANCHKIPGTEFEKRRASVEQCTAAFHSFFEWRKSNRPELKVVFTVSPVRHLGDGFHQNQLSKSILHLFIEEMQNKYENVFYFPSYEIFMDDLRDYRYYDADLCHPSAQGLAYVKELVADAFFSEETKKRVLEIEKELRRNAHRPLL